MSVENAIEEIKEYEEEFGVKFKYWLQFFFFLPEPIPEPTIQNQKKHSLI
jgi:hypothetical protein